VEVAERQRVLILALLASLILWNLPFGGLILYPFKLLSTWFHELCHGMVMLVTGAGFSHLEIFRDTSGIAYAREEAGPVASALIASAGYLGASTAGAVLLVLGQGERVARIILLGLGILLAVTGIVWVHNDFGLVAVAIGAGACALAAALGSERLAVYAVNFIAAQACVQAVLDIRVLFRTELVINGRAVGASDAHAMASATFGSSKLWASVWLFASFVAFFVAMRAMKRREHISELVSAREPARPPPSPP
jgi:hypothetical protein